MADERQQVIEALRSAGVSGSDDFGYFVNRPDLFRPSDFDERTAMPVLLDLLPSLNDPKVVASAARHLRNRWSRPTAFDALLTSYRRWATNGGVDDAGWALGDALVTAATSDEAQILFDVVLKRDYGTSRQMIVHQLWRFRSDPITQQVLGDLLEDPDVSLHAISAYRRTVGDEVALARLARLARETSDTKVQQQASRALRAIEKKRK